jgi:hypothetical protein
MALATVSPDVKRKLSRFVELGVVATVVVAKRIRYVLLVIALRLFLLFVSARTELQTCPIRRRIVLLQVPAAASALSQPNLHR